MQYYVCCYFVYEIRIQWNTQILYHSLKIFLSPLQVNEIPLICRVVPFTQKDVCYGFNFSLELCLIFLYNTKIIHMKKSRCHFQPTLSICISYLQFQSVLEQNKKFAFAFSQHAASIYGFVCKLVSFVLFVQKKFRPLQS